MRKLLIFLVCIIAVLFGLAIYFYFSFKPAAQVNFNISFSDRYAAYLGFNPKQVFLDILSDLKPKKVRIMAYWEDIEPKQNQFNFADFDYMLNLAEKDHTDVVLVLGRK